MAGNKNPIHGVERRKFYQTTWFAELVATVPPVIASGIAAFDAYPVGRWGWLTLSLIWFVIGQIVALVIAAKKEKEAENQRNHDGLRGAANVLYGIVSEKLLRDSNEEHGLRVTVHRVEPPLDDPQNILQLIDYVGSGTGAGRLFPIRSGITGCAVRERVPYVMDRAGGSEDEYKKELVSAWHYTEADAKKATMDRFSAMAFPVTDRSGQHVVAVVYLDTRRKGAFSDEMQELVIDSCRGITTYVGERYV